MNTIAVSHHTAFKAPVSAIARIATGLAVVGFVSAAWLSAGSESQHAVEMTTAALSRTYVTLQPVQITAQRAGQLVPVAATTGGRAATAF